MTGNLATTGDFEKLDIRVEARVEVSPRLMLRAFTVWLVIIAAETVHGMPSPTR